MSLNSNNKVNDVLKYGKSNSIVANMVFSLIKEKILKTKIEINETNYEYLYDIEYNQNKLEKYHFNEKIKEIVDGLFNAIIFMKKEKDIKLKEIQYNQRYFNKNAINNQKRRARRTRSSSVVYETDKALLEDDSNKIELLNRIMNTQNHTESGRKNKRSSTLFVIKNKPNNENNVIEQPPIIQKENYYKLQSESKLIYEKTAEKILSYFNDEIVKKVKIISNEGDITDFKYFFILLTNLSVRQVEILNNTQNSNMSPELIRNLPIFFSRQFKNTLNPAQRNIFDKLRILSLIRCKVLADSNKKISVDNINFNIFHLNIRFNDIKLRYYSDITKKIRQVMDLGQDSSKQIDSSPNNYIMPTNKTDVIRKFISNKSRIIEQDEENSNISSDSDGEIDKNEEKENIDFKYRREFNFKKFRNDLIEELNYSYMMYSKDEIDNIILLIKSPLFVKMMNCLDLEDIQDLDKEHTMLFELLKKELKRIETKQLMSAKRKEGIPASDSSEEDLDIDINERELKKKRMGSGYKYSMDFSNFHNFKKRLNDLNNNDENNEINVDLSQHLKKYNENNNVDNNSIMKTSTNVYK